VSWTPHHALVAPENASPGGWLLFLHGIFGSGPNWRTIARKLIAARPDWGAVLVDLRMHGRSQGAPPPHTLDAAAGDLERLAADLHARGMVVAGVIGHSFGGKAALAYRARGPALVDTWVLDASPSRRPEMLSPEDQGTPGEGAMQVLAMLESLPGQFSSRDDFMAEVTGRGFSRPLAEWLAMNLDRDGDRMRLRLDLAALRELLVDYAEQDLWPAVESSDLPGQLHVAIGSRSTAVDDEDRRRFERHAQVHAVDAGHWLHMEAPDALLRLFIDELARPPGG
jgi:esterase